MKKILATLIAYVVILSLAFPLPVFAAEPSVTTAVATDIAETTATLNGEITNLGGADYADKRGFDWDTDSGAPYANDWTEVGLKDYYNTGQDDQSWAPHDTYWTAQTFTTTSAYTVTNIKCKLAKQAVGDFDVIISIRETSGGLPTGGDLSATGTTVGQTLPVYDGLGNGVWRSFDIGDYALSDSTTYAVVMRTDSASAYARWDRDADEGYAGGQICTSLDSGSSWSTYGGDRMFEACSSFSIGTFSHGVTGLPPDTTIYFRAKARNVDGWAYGGELTFDTLLPLPGVPIDFTLTELDMDVVSITWTKGTYAATTVIRGQKDSYPETVADGFEVYNGAGTSTEQSGLDLDLYAYYYRAWSHNDTGYSTTHAEANIGGGNMDLLALFTLTGILGAMCIGITFVGLRSRDKGVWWMYAAGLMWFIFAVAMMIIGASVGDLGVLFRTGLGGLGFIATFACFFTTWKGSRPERVDEGAAWGRQVNKTLRNVRKNKQRQERETRRHYRDTSE